MRYHVVHNPYPNMKLWTVPPGHDLPKEGFGNYQEALSAMERCQSESNDLDPKFLIVAM